MASALYTDIKKWKDGKPGSIFCRPREGLFGMRDWADDPELAHLVAPSNGPDGEEKFLVMSSENAKRGHMKRGGASRPMARRDSPDGAASGESAAERVRMVAGADGGLDVLLAAATAEGDIDAEGRRRAGAGTGAGATTSGKRPRDVETPPPLAETTAEPAVEHSKDGHVVRHVPSKRRHVVGSSTGVDPAPTAPANPFREVKRAPIDVAVAAANPELSRRRDLAAAWDHPRIALARAAGLNAVRAAGAGMFQHPSALSAAALDHAVAAETRRASAATAPPPQGPGGGASAAAAVAASPADPAADRAVALAASFTAAAAGASAVLDQGALGSAHALGACVRSLAAEASELYVLLGPHPATVRTIVALLVACAAGGERYQADQRLVLTQLWEACRGMHFPNGVGETEAATQALRRRVVEMVEGAIAAAAGMNIGAVAAGAGAGARARADGAGLGLGLGLGLGGAYKADAEAVARAVAMAQAHAREQVQMRAGAAAQVAVARAERPESAAS